MKVQGKIVLVTGASRGIGAATAIEAAANGAKEVVMLARSKKDLIKIAMKVEEKGATARIHAVDLQDPAAITATCNEIKAASGVPDIIINNAGAGRWLYTEETEPDELQMMISLPYLGAFNITREFLSEMIKRDSGHILNVNSPASRMPWPGSVGYSASRWALRGFTEALRVDLRHTNLKVTHFVCGKVTSGYWEANPGAEDRMPTISKLIRILTPEEVGKRIIKAIQRNKKNYVFPFMLKFFYALHFFFPGIVVKVTAMTGDRKK